MCLPIKAILKALFGRRSKKHAGTKKSSTRRVKNSTHRYQSVPLYSSSSPSSAASTMKYACSKAMDSSCSLYHTPFCSDRRIRISSERHRAAMAKMAAARMANDDMRRVDL